MSDKYDKEILEQMARIDEDSKNIQIPDKVKPDNMMKRIDELEKKGYFEGTDKMVKKAGNSNRKKKLMAMITGAGATIVAASLTVAVLVQRKEVNDAVNTGVTGMYAQNMRVETYDGMCVLSSYKELNEYMVAMNSKRQAEKNDYKDMFVDEEILYENSIVDEDDGTRITYAADESIEGEAPTESATSGMADGTNNAAGNEDDKADDFSDTNTRTEGVSEADIVKTDGKYIYHLCYDSGTESTNLLITSAAGADSKRIAEVALIDDVREYINDEKIEGLYEKENYKKLCVYGSELIVSGDKLVIVVQPEVYGSSYYYASMVFVMTYDISDKAAPELISTLALEGEYDSCKMVDGYVYVFAEMYNYDVQSIYDHTNCTEAEAAKIYAPEICGEYLPAECVYVTNCESFDQYHIIATIDMNDVSSFHDVKAVLGESGCVNKYVSANNIYIITDIWNEWDAYCDKLENATENEIIMIDEQSEIMRFSYNNGDIISNGRVVINGSVGDEFDIDEYNGYLRMAVSTRTSEYICKKIEVEYYDGLQWIMGNDWEYNVSWSSSAEASALYIYNENLELVGSIPKLQENEQVYGVRFDGDIAYVVTYEQTDPLFTIDLSDPTNPKVMGELKIPGFSTYLHKWDENKLIGLGYDEYGQVKVSTFDITDKYDVKETEVYSIEGVYWSEALYNHKAVFVSPQKNLIGFALEDYYANDEELMDYGFRVAYKIFSYVDGQLTEVISCILDGYDSDARGMYIGDYIYIVSEANGVYVYDINSFDFVTNVK